MCPPVVCQEAEEKLNCLRSIRTLLVEEGALELDTRFPIVEMKGRSHANGHFLGYCRGKHDAYVQVSPVRKLSTVNRTHKIEVRLTVTVQRVNEPDEERTLSLLALIPTFLHELAHSITPGVLTYGVDPDSGKGKKSRRWRFDAHCDLFYANFAEILRVAEDLGIFVLPKRQMKLSHKSLLRFDALDISVAPTEQIGASPRFASQGSYFSGSSESEARKHPLVYLLEFKGKKKLMRLGSGQAITRKCLIDAAKQKFRCKPQRILSRGGQELSDEEVRRLEPGSVLVFA